MVLRDKDIPLELRLKYPEIMLYCTKEAQDRLVKMFKRILNEYGAHRFCEEMAVMVRSMKNDQYSERIKKITNPPFRKKEKKNE